VTDDQIAARLAVLGAGAMWVSIATLGHGLPVLLVDVDGARLDQRCINVAKQSGLAQLMGARVRDGPIDELVTSTSPHDAAEATAVVKAITEVAELKSKALGELRSLTSTIHVAFYA
jgi:methoxymalonate biosynthesis protein